MYDQDLDRESRDLGPDNTGAPEETREGQKKDWKYLKGASFARDSLDTDRLDSLKRSHVARRTAAKREEDKRDDMLNRSAEESGVFDAAHIDSGNQGVPSTIRGAKGLSPDLVDNQLKEQLQNALDSDLNLLSYGLGADVVEREAQISGVVDTLAEKKRAEELARRIPGITRVNAAIAVSADGPITDKDVEFEVSEELEAHPDVNTKNIGAKVERGVVTLVGNTSDPAEVKAAREAASKARGVTEVHSQVKVRSKRGSEKGTDEAGREKNPRH